MQIKEIVFDTNTWVTFFYNAQFDKLVELKLQKQIIIYSCLQQELELSTVLQRKKFSKKITLPMNEYIDFYQRIATIVEVVESFDRLEDSKDNYIIDLAYTAKADHIISSDRHILSLKHLKEIQIISLSDFKKRLKL
jgi:putative PIN family toxin of toxin-antitoxin system